MIVAMKHYISKPMAGLSLNPEQFTTFDLKTEESLQYIATFRNWCHLQEKILGIDPHYAFENEHATPVQQEMMQSMNKQGVQLMTFFHAYRNAVSKWCIHERDVAMKWDISNSGNKFPELTTFVPTVLHEGEETPFLYNKSMQAFFKDFFSEVEPQVFLKYIDMCLQHTIYCTNDLGKKTLVHRTQLRATLNCFNKYVNHLTKSKVTDIQAAKQSLKKITKVTRKPKKKTRKAVVKMNRSATSFPFRKFSAEELLD